MPAPRAGSRPGARRTRLGGGLFAQAVDEVGRRIVRGELVPGAVVSMDEVGEELGTSRSVLREAFRVLGTLGLVEARQQVGTRVLDRSHWDLLSPIVIRWRSEGPEADAQTRELLEMRLGIEPVAARLAAERISEAEGREILRSAHALRAAFERQDPRGYFEEDARFHRMILEASGNAVLAQLADPISTTLDVRGHEPRSRRREILASSVDTHVALAEAVHDGDGMLARQRAYELVSRTLAEFGIAHPQELPEARGRETGRDVGPDPDRPSGA